MNDSVYCQKDGRLRSQSAKVTENLKYKQYINFKTVLLYRYHHEFSVTTSKGRTIMQSIGGDDGKFKIQTVYKLQNSVIAPISS